MSNARGIAAPLPQRERWRGSGGIVLRIALALLGLVGRLAAFVVHWPWAHHRATTAFRRALREAGLPPEAVERLARTYASAGNPRLLLRLALRWRP